MLGLQRVLLNGNHSQPCSWFCEVIGGRSFCSIDDEELFLRCVQAHWSTYIQQRTKRFQRLVQGAFTRDKQYK